MKNIKKTYIVLILLLSLSMSSYACWWEGQEDWASFYDENYKDYDSYDEFLKDNDLTLQSLDNQNLGEVEVTAEAEDDIPIIIDDFIDNYDNDPSWDLNSDTDFGHDQTIDNPPTKDCAGVENGTAYIDNCQECVGGNTGKEPCDCEGIKCPICGGIVIIDSQETIGGLMKVSVLNSKCKKCTCLKWYTKAQECNAYKQMFDDAIAQRNEYCAIITENNIYTWKTENSDGGSLFGPFSPVWDSANSLWYINDRYGNKQYIYGVAHVHWQTNLPYFSVEADGDFGSACKLHGVPLYLFTAQGDVEGIVSNDGKSVSMINNLDSYTVQKLINCQQSLIDFGR